MSQNVGDTATRGCPITRLLKPDTADAPASGLARMGVFTYGLVAYAFFFVTFLYAVGFVGNWFVPKSIDTGTRVGLAESLLINTALLSVFVIQHTIMARPAFKRWWTRVVPVSIERSTFVLAATAALALVFWQWRPLPEVVWSVDNTIAAAALTALSLGGWLLALASSFMVSHWDLFGLRQVYLRATGRPYTQIGFKERGVYRLVRHPLMLGFFIFVWATPHMTVGHLFFAAMITAYIFLGTALEERDLLAHLGAQYEDYRRRVPGIFPIPRSLRRRA
jgi:protein-S-isoprenylcysteine O-methyltransferase Ste14